MHRCEWCQEETCTVVPVVDRDPNSFQEHALVCLGCADTSDNELSAIWYIGSIYSGKKILSLSVLEVA